MRPSGVIADRVVAYLWATRGEWTTGPALRHRVTGLCPVESMLAARHLVWWPDHLLTVADVAHAADWDVAWWRHPWVYLLRRRMLRAAGPQRHA